MNEKIKNVYNLFLLPFFYLCIFYIYVIELIRKTTCSTCLYFPYNDYVLVFYLLSYKIAYMPRSLIGSIFLFASKWISPNLFFLINFLLLLLFYSYIILWFYFFIKKMKYAQSAILISMLFCCSPLFMLNFIDLGRFDIYLIYITFILSAILKYSKKMFALHAVILIPLGTLIHEIYLISFVPFLLSLSWLISNRERHSKIPIYGVLLGFAIALLNLIIMRVNMPEGKCIITFIQQHNILAIKDPTLILYYWGQPTAVRSYMDHFLWTLRNGWWAHTFISVGFWLLTLYYPVKIILNNLGKNRNILQVYMCLLSCFSPICLILVGSDSTRWMALSFWCFLFLFIFTFDFFHDNFHISMCNTKEYTEIGIIVLFCIVGGHSNICYFNSWISYFLIKYEAFLQLING